MSANTASGTGGGFSDDERQAMKDRAAELKAEASRSTGSAKKQAAEELDALEKIAAMADGDRQLAERIHALVTTHAPELRPKTWYGQPAYARDGKVVCFFRSGIGDKERYSTLGFSANANLDDPSGLWPSSYALTEITPAAEQRIIELLTQAVA